VHCRYRENTSRYRELLSSHSLAGERHRNFVLAPEPWHECCVFVFASHLQEGIDKKSRNRIQVVPVDQSLKWTEANVRLAPHPCKKVHGSALWFAAERGGGQRETAVGDDKDHTRLPLDVIALISSGWQ